LLNRVAEHALFQTTRIYDRHGKLLYELYDHQIGKGRRTYINYKDISPLLIQATIAAEDHTFWNNTGVDYIGIGRAALSNLEHHGIVEGGSTITQQLVKNQFFQQQPRTVQVKLEESILATGLTHQYPKWKIMEMYLNTVYYGDTNYGAEAAAEGYFSLPPQCTRPGCKPAVSHLTLGQASMLAGLPQSPSIYNPVAYKERALVRQEHVLQSMIELGMITHQQEEDAIQEMKNFKFRAYSDTHHMQAPHFVNYVIDQLTKQFGAEALETGGYQIYTTLDLDLQKKVEQIVYDHLYKAQSDSYMGYYGPLYRTNNVNNAAAVVMNPATGEILAMDGSASNDPTVSTPQMQGAYNAATAERQPGSSFKPVVYSTAFEMGWYPAMIVPDHKTYYPGGEPGKPYSPQNYDGAFHSGYPITVRTALANSFNIPAITTLEFAGIPHVINMAARLGLTEVAKRPLNTLGPSMALGTVEVSPLHLTAAYAVFANHGVRVPTTYVSKILDNQGHEIYHLDPKRQQQIRVMRPEVAFLISSILSDGPARYHEFPRGNPLELDRPVAAKTGTTDSFRDNWTLGYTPHLAVGVWAGNSDNSIMQNVIGITGAGPIWHEVMKYASEYYHFPPDGFDPPPNVHKASVSALSGLKPKPGEPTVTDWFIDGTQPTVLSPADLTPTVLCYVSNTHEIRACKPEELRQQKHHHDDDDDDDHHHHHHHHDDDDD
jgi:membrane peptidoglycan carboxypeptidase